MDWLTDKQNNHQINRMANRSIPPCFFAVHSFRSMLLSFFSFTKKFHHAKSVDLLIFQKIRITSDEDDNDWQVGRCNDNSEDHWLFLLIVNFSKLRISIHNYTSQFTSHLGAKLVRRWHPITYSVITKRFSQDCFWYILAALQVYMSICLSICPSDCNASIKKVENQYYSTNENVIRGNLDCVAVWFN